MRGKALGYLGKLNALHRTSITVKFELEVNWSENPPTFRDYFVLKINSTPYDITPGEGGVQFLVEG